MRDIDFTADKLMNIALLVKRSLRCNKFIDDEIHNEAVAVVKRFGSTL